MLGAMEDFQIPEGSELSPDNDSLKEHEILCKLEGSSYNAVAVLAFLYDLQNAKKS